jgi:hypothetical protein
MNSNNSNSPTEMMETRCVPNLLFDGSLSLNIVPVVASQEVIVMVPTLTLQQNESPSHAVSVASVAALRQQPEAPIMNHSPPSLYEMATYPTYQQHASASMPSSSSADPYTTLPVGDGAGAPHQYSSYPSPTSYRSTYQWHQQQQEQPQPPLPHQHSPHTSYPYTNPAASFGGVGYGSHADNPPSTSPRERERLRHRTLSQQHSESPSPTAHRTNFDREDD